MANKFEVGDTVQSLEDCCGIVKGSHYLVIHVTEYSLQFTDDEGCLRTRSVDDYILIPRIKNKTFSPNTENRSDKQVFDSGAQRDTTEGKPRPDLIPGVCMLRVGEWFGMGAEKYGERNFEKGIPSSRSLASLQRHLERFKSGDDSEDHLSAIVANAMFLIFNEETFCGSREILDLPWYGAEQ